MAMVVMEKQDYMDKAMNLVEQPTYRPLLVDLTNRYKAKLINIIKRIKRGDSGIDDTTYRRMYPTGVCSPKFYGLPKIHKEDIPLRPTVPSRDSVNYGIAKE